VDRPLVLVGDGEDRGDTTTGPLDMTQTTIDPSDVIECVAGEWKDVYVTFRGSNGKRKTNFESEGLFDTTNVTMTNHLDPHYEEIYEYILAPSDLPGKYILSLRTNETLTIDDNVRLIVSAK
jgi:hypothetical protein